MSKVALIAGASGLVGSSLVELLLNGAEYSQVISLQRGPSSLMHPKLKVIQIDFDALDAVSLPAITDVYCCLGTTIKKAGSKEAFKKIDYAYPLALAKLGASYGAKHFIIITAMGANSSSFIFYSKVKGELQDDLAKNQVIPEISIVQPSLLLGHRTDARVGEGIGIKIATTLNKFFHSGIGIQAADVAKAMYVIGTQYNKKGTQQYRSSELKKIAATQ
ncbi:NAD-dependent epimerase/dehydratase family protein [uncultured Cytophaga sp.]|uniref:NAD-dependent epimerase/dehydratase family protein n=1 Tax=uncultured Cytophaga sp. TaxID=160238 RepID=UPI00261F09D0|nr:NAD-dependent epimerase/dehydratase family protein [uncultured Cytophaga sp.]